MLWMGIKVKWSTDGLFTPHFEDGKCFIVFEQVVEHIPGVDDLVLSPVAVSDEIAVGHLWNIERSFGDGFACKIEQVSYPITILARPFDRLEPARVNVNVIVRILSNVRGRR